MWLGAEKRLPTCGELNTFEQKETQSVIKDILRSQALCNLRSFGASGMRTPKRSWAIMKLSIRRPGQLESEQHIVVVAKDACGHVDEELAGDAELSDDARNRIRERLK